MEQIDRRIRRTKKLLEDALVELTLEKEYKEITIQEITDRADIGYRTFFRHYSDKNDLLKDVLNKTMLELRELIAPPRVELFMNTEINISKLVDYAVIFRHVEEHADLYRVLLNSDRSFVESIMAFAVQEIAADFNPKIEMEIPFDIIANHMVAATFAIVRWWIEEGMTIPAEKMGQYSTRLIAQPIREMIIQDLSN